MDKETRDILRSIRAGICTLVVMVAVLGIVLLVRQNGTLGEFVLFILGIGVFILVVLVIVHLASSVII